MQKLFEKNIKFFYHNLPQYYELIIKAKKTLTIKNDNLYTSNNTPIYPNSITEDSETFAMQPTHNPLWEKNFFVIKPKKWDKNFYITGKIINSMINKAESLPSYSEDGFYFDKDFLPTTVIFGLLAGKHLDLLVDRYEFQSSRFLYMSQTRNFSQSASILRIMKKSIQNLMSAFSYGLTERLIILP